MQLCSETSWKCLWNLQFYILYICRSTNKPFEGLCKVNMSKQICDDCQSVCVCYFSNRLIVLDRPVR